MSKISEVKIKNLIHSMALKYNMSDEDMKNLLNSPYEFAKIKINKMDLKSIETKEELDKTKTNFMFRSLFKLVVEWRTVNGKLKKRDNINKENNKKWKK